MANRNYPTKPAPGAAPAPSYLGGFMGPMGEDPVTRKGNTMQHMGSVVGRRGAGLSSITGGDQLAHSLHRYGKANNAPMPGGLKGLIGGGT